MIFIIFLIEMTSEKWYTLAGYPEYSICDEYPHAIRNKVTGKIITEYTNERGYVTVKLRGKNVRKHRLIATQFLPNPSELTQVDHINNIRSDNRIKNLRWTNAIQNCNNKAGDECVPQLPDDAIIVDSYGDWEFEDLYWSNDVFYKFNGIDYKIIKRQQKPCGTYLVKARDIDSIQHCIYFPKFKREYGLE